MAAAVLLSLFSLLVAGLVAAPAALATDCASEACFDALPVDRSWRGAIDLDDVPNRYQGAGITVASIDTGVTPNVDLGPRLLARVDFTDDHDGLDTLGHGTHIAGLIAGSGVVMESQEGAAPEANLVSVKVAGWDGATDASTVIAALRWVVSNKDRYGIRVVSLAWGTDARSAVEGDPLAAAVERAVDAGLVVVVAAGNRGPGRVTRPGDDASVITVGAADVHGTAAGGDDTIAPFSSFGTIGGDRKPDLLAPGVSLISDRAPGSTVDAAHPGARVGDRLFKGSGTSQAAGIVAGVAARIIEANPGLTPAQVKAALVRSGDRRLAGPAAGAGLIDAWVAVGSVLPFKRSGPLSALPEVTALAATLPVGRSTGLGSLAAARGSAPLVADVDGDGLPDDLAGEVDALGAPWTPLSLREPWTAATWAATAWAPRVAEIAGSAPAPPWTGPSAPLLAWDAAYWGARGLDDAGFDARYWGARYWGARYWGTGAWE